ncbi:MAG TPA: two-component system response regulator, partial [Oceanospirillaceae bacterium]|nr:two-component system response regulator [Oceanospirillaceae bacterium]
IKPLIFARLQEALHNYRDHLQKLQQLDQLAQTDVDSLLKQSAKQTTTGQERLPKGVDALTLNKVRDAFADNPQELFSAEQMGSIIGASRTTARRYLEYLTSTEEVKTEVNYGSVGRPERRYTKL